MAIQVDPNFKVTIGADPEAFIRDSETEAFIPAFGLIKGEKGAPAKIPGAPRNSELFWHPDNAAVEFNFGVTGDPGQLYVMIDSATKYANKYMRSIKPTYHVGFYPDAGFSKDVLANPNLQKIGCDPDFCAYEQDGDRLTPRTPPNIREFGPNRFAGGHIHLGYNNREDVPCWAVAMLLDAFISLRHTARGLTMNERRSFYGQAGLFRPKKYGVEYRTPSAAYLDHSHIALATFSVAREIGSIVSFKPDETSALFQRIPWKDVRNSIDNCSSLDCEALFIDIKMMYKECIGSNIHPL